jgi:hypothetical protein
MLLMHPLLGCVLGFVRVLPLRQWVPPYLLCWFRRVLLEFEVRLFRLTVIVWQRSAVFLLLLRLGVRFVFVRLLQGRGRLLVLAGQGATFHCWGCCS